MHWIIQSAIRRFELFQDDDLAQTGRGYKARQLSLTWIVCTGVIAIMANAVPALTPSHKAGCDLCVAAVMDGKYTGKRLQELGLMQQALFVTQLFRTCSVKQRRTKISRLIAKLGGHGLIAKVKDARLYRLTLHRFTDSFC